MAAERIMYAHPKITTFNGVKSVYIKEGPHK